MNESSKQQFHAVIAKVLRLLDKELDDFEQTTHGSMLTLGDPVENLLTGLRAALTKPSAFTISDLSQAIGYYLREKPDGH